MKYAKEICKGDIRRMRKNKIGQQQRERKKKEILREENS